MLIERQIVRVGVAAAQASMAVRRKAARTTIMRTGVSDMFLHCQIS
jgi:hypothetical protein